MYITKQTRLMALKSRLTWVSQHVHVHLSFHFNGRFPGGPVLADTSMSPFWILLELMGDGGCDINWSYKSCKASVKSSPSTNQHPVFYRPDALPVAHLTVSKY